MKMDILEQFGMGCDMHCILWKQVNHSLFPVSTSCDSHYGYFKVVFGVYGHIECQNGQFGAIWDGL